MKKMTFINAVVFVGVCMSACNMQAMGLGKYFTGGLGQYLGNAMGALFAQAPVTEQQLSQTQEKALETEQLPGDSASKGVAGELAKQETAVKAKVTEPTENGFIHGATVPVLVLFVACLMLKPAPSETVRRW